MVDLGYPIHKINALLEKIFQACMHLVALVTTIINKRRRKVPDANERQIS